MLVKGCAPLILEEKKKFARIVYRWRARDNSNQTAQIIYTEKKKTKARKMLVAIIIPHV